MSVAKCLGVDDLDAPNMQGVRAEWPRWQGVEPALNVVDDIAVLPRWLKIVKPRERDAVLAALARVAQRDRCAYVALAWLLASIRGAVWFARLGLGTERQRLSGRVDAAGLSSSST